MNKTTYKAILRSAEIKKKQFISTIKQKCCIDCINKDKQDCLEIEHKLENSVQVYKCVNYSK